MFTRLLEAVERAVRPALDKSALYPAIVTTSTSREVACRPLDARLPAALTLPLRSFVPGAIPRLKSGATVYVGWEKGRGRMYAMAVEDPAGEVALGDDGGMPVARLGDQARFDGVIGYLQLSGHGRLGLVEGDFLISVPLPGFAGGCIIGSGNVTKAA